MAPACPTVFSGSAFFKGRATVGEETVRIQDHSAGLKSVSPSQMGWVRKHGKDKKEGKEILIVESGEDKWKDKKKKKRKHEEKSLSKDGNGHTDLIDLGMFLVAANSIAKAHLSSGYQWFRSEAFIGKSIPCFDYNFDIIKTMAFYPDNFLKLKNMRFHLKKEG